MPIYEYQCENCKEIFEKILGINTPVPELCLLCGERGKIKKLVSAPSFRLKGSGWYETDFKTGDKKNLLKGDNEGKTVKAKTKDETKGTSTDNSKNLSNKETKKK